MSDSVNNAVPAAQLRRALVIKLRHHGDVLLTSPVLSVLKTHAPQCEIDALVYADTAPMLELHPALDKLHTIDRRWKQIGIFAQAAAEWRLLRQLRARQYDLVIHLTEHRRGAWLTRLLRPRFSVAPKVAGRNRLWGNSFSHLFAQPTAARRHTVERNLDALRRIGIYPSEDQRAVTLVPGAAATTRVDGLLAAHGLYPRAYVHIHPTSRWSFKGWTVQGWAWLINQLVAEGMNVVVTCAPEPRELTYLDTIKAELAHPVVDLGGKLSLHELAALAGSARAFVGVDSAPMHAAAAMGTPVVALFGPSGEFEWGPWGTPRHGSHTVVASTQPQHRCRPCGLDGCGGGKVSDCLVSLDSGEVLARIRALIA